MAEEIFQESAFRFSDPIRYFKANDPYYFEVDNIPLKQLQENCLWLKDQIRQIPVELSNVKRADIDELKPYATGGDRVVRVKPGRYTARVNDASTKQPLSFLTQLVGNDVGETDAYNVTIPQTNTVQAQALLDALEKFKSSLAEDSLAINGLETRLFTWPVYSPHTPIGLSGVTLDDNVNYIKYADSGSIGSEVENLNAVISEALVWVLGEDEPPNSYLVEALISNSPEQSGGMSLLPRLEANFIKYWRGVARTAVVDIDEELTIDVPVFDTNDFNWIDDAGNENQVTGVASRIDLVFIYTKPVDVSSTTIIKPSGKEVITKPQLGIVRGAGIKTNFDNDLAPNAQNGVKQFVTDEHNILASPGDSNNDSLGFTATSGNDITFDVRGSFPTPDDILNLAPLISEQLEDNAIELVGQSILPVAYVWVKEEGTPLTNGSVPVLSTDVIDIRPFFRTTELAYNERAGIAAAVPQLSLANPAVGKVQMDYENVRLKNTITSEYQTYINQILGQITVQDREFIIFPKSEQYEIYNTGLQTNSSFMDGFFGNSSSSAKRWYIQDAIRPEHSLENVESVLISFAGNYIGDIARQQIFGYFGPESPSQGTLQDSNFDLIYQHGARVKSGDLDTGEAGMINRSHYPCIYEVTQDSSGQIVPTLSFLTYFAKDGTYGSAFRSNHTAYVHGYIVKVDKPLV